jgi:hypothetical protein
VAHMTHIPDEMHGRRVHQTGSQGVSSDEQF